MSCDWPNRLPFGLRGADDFEGQAFDGDGFADRVDVGEEAVFEVGADEDYGEVALLVDVAKEAAEVDLRVAHHGGVGGHALDGDSGDGVRDVGDGAQARAGDAGFANEVHAAADELIFFLRELGIFLLGFKELFGVLIAAERSAEDAEAVGAHGGGAAGDVNVHAVDDGHYGDQRGCREHDAEQGEGAAEFAGA